ncbi:MAG: choice-of-anchor D domain-containing protein [Polyangiales bacterium]
MHRRWLGLFALLLWLGWSRPARATLVFDPTTPAPVVFTDVPFGTTVSTLRTIASDSPPEELTSFVLTGTGCAAYTLTPSKALPQNISGGNTLNLTIEFKPLLRQTYNCTVTLRTNSMANGSFPMTGNGVAPVISTNPSTTATFTDVRVANGVVQSSTQTIRITNSTTDVGQNLTISMIGLGGANPGAYAITAAPSIPTILAPAAFIDVTLTFNPSTSGPQPASFLIMSDDPSLMMKSVALAGNGTNAVSATSNAAFGIVAGGSFGSANVNVTNSAAAPVGTLTVFSASIAPTTWFTFDANGAGCSGMTSCTFAANTVAPRAIAVRCSPPLGATGTQNATVTVVSDTDGGGDDLGTLSCTAGRPDITVSPATMAFGNQTANTTSAPMPIVVQNTGNTLLTYQIAASGGTPAAFPLVGCPVAGCTLGAGLTAMHNVTFSPTTNTALSTTFNVTSDDPDVADQLKTVMVSGTGTAPQISVPGSLDFMSVEIPDTSSLTLVATNTGNASLNITSSTLTSGASDYAITAGGTGAQTVAALGTTSWTIRCNPSTTGTRTGNFRIVSNSLTGATTNVALTCTGLQGSLATTPATTVIAPLDFGGVTVGATSTLSFTLRNPGNVTVSGIAGVLAPATVGYSIDPTTPVPTTLTAGQAVSINVKFSPTATMDGGPATIMFTGNWGTAKTAAVTLFIAGDGLTAGYDVVTIPTTSPPVLDFGSFRWDTTATATFCIVNTDQAPVTIQSVVLAPTAPTVASELQVTAVRRNATCAVTANATVTVPQTLTSGQILVVTVVAAPAARTGLLEGVVTVDSTLMTNSMRTVALTGMSTTAMLTTTPGLSIDFGDVDRDGPPAVRTVTITNTGNAGLNLSTFARTPVTGPFSFTLPATQVVPVGGHIDVGVTYTPTMEHAVGVFDQVVLSHNIGGVLGGPLSQMIMMRGRGVDRHISLAAAPTFPETFRNPGSKAPEMAVTVNNTGEAPLVISAVMLTNSDVWQVVDPAPVTIPSKSSHAFMVRFTPKMAGPAPVGQLMFMNNDNSLPVPMATMNLAGNGLDRHVIMTDTGGLATIDLGLTAIGIPVTLTDGLVMVNQDGTHDFEVRELTFDDGSLFSITNTPAGVNLPAGGTQRYSVVFTPANEEGPFETTANLYLDEDPTVTTTVKVKGEAVFVDLTGSGGCSTGGGGTGTGALLVIGALVLRRRRRLAASAIALGLALVAWPAASRADAQLDLSLFNPTPSTTGTGFQVQPASVGDDGTFAAAATVSYATDPLVAKFSGGEHMSITQRTTMELGLAYAFLGRFEAGARMPLYNQSGDGQMLGITSPSGTARGDLVLHGKAQLARVDIGGDGLLFAAAALSLTLPTATNDAFAGVDKPTGRAYGLLTVMPGVLAKRLSFTANLGAVVRQKTSISNIEQGSGLAWGIGGSVRVLDQLWVTGEMFGDVMPSSHKDSAMASSGVLAPAEYLVGISYHPDRRFSLGLAAGRGLIAGVGTPDVRGVFSLSFVPGTAELAPIHPPPPPKIDGDADNDGIKDSADRCPEQAEDKDMFDDTDGCPDLDNDSDGFADAKDMCPLDAEDKDGFQDDDGCPDKDNDNDGVPDAQDKCPNTPEDKDGFLDIDGCPDPDNDNDGIVDQQDMCPNEQETINGNTDDDGCPDRGDALVVVTPAAIETTEAIQFTGTKVAKASSNVLAQVAGNLRAHQEIVRVKLVVHVQPSGDADKDQELSDKRAQAVRDWLVQWGIAQSRISAQGMGGAKPLVPRTAKQAQLINDRVEMIILERK